jgi:hypothetical protein
MGRKNKRADCGEIVGLMTDTKETLKNQFIKRLIRIAL